MSAQIDYFENYQMYGLVSSMKDYRLAFFINNELGLDLKKYEDFQPMPQGGSYSWFCHRHTGELTSYYLFGNHHEKEKLIPIQKSLDYFFLIKAGNNKKAEELISKLRTIVNINGVFLLEMNKIKDMNTYIEVLELHELEHVILPQKPGFKIP